MINVGCVTIDCADPGLVAQFWSEALGWERREHVVLPPGGMGIYLEFVPVPESKTIKNRVHLGLNTPNLDEEAARLEGLGATFAWEEEFPEHWGYRNLVLRDPEGNEFCLGTSTGTHIRNVIERAKDVLQAADVDATGASRAVEALNVLAFTEGMTS